jgi:methylthioribose-1-phosphate isomerase
MNVTVNGRTRHYRTISFNARQNRVVLIEQRLLPHRFKLVETQDFRATARAIRDMIVRGAGAIGATAAYGLAQGARAFKGRGIPAFEKHIDQRHATGSRANDRRQNG